MRIFARSAYLILVAIVFLIVGTLFLPIYCAMEGWRVVTKKKAPR